jgi:hypothetical protein
MNTRQGVALGVIVGVGGAVLLFALKNHDAVAAGVRLQSLGGVLLGAGLLLVGGLAIASLRGGGDGSGDGGSGESSTVRALGGLIAVVVGVLAVATLAIVTLTRFGAKEHESMVAVASSAFGVISAVVGAYLGIKITGDAANEKQKVNVAQAQVDATNKAVQKIAPEHAAQVKEAGERVGAVMPGSISHQSEGGG